MLDIGPLAIVSDNDVALFAIFVVFGLPMIAVLIMRGLRHRERQLEHLERIEMIRQGIDPGKVIVTPPGPDFSNAKTRGAYVNYHLEQSPSAQAALQRGLVLMAVGLAITLGLSFLGNGPWLIGGFVPLFIGIAQVLIAMTSGARLGPSFPPRPPEAPPTPPPGAQTPPYPGATYEGSYTYRPGGTQELRPPTPPPAER